MIAKGYVRKLEITYNQKRDDYNPHFHVLIAVNKSYFTDKRYYISQKEWLNLWRDVTGNPEITQVHVQKIKQNSNKELYEMAKYSGYIYQIFYTWNKKEYLASELFDLTESEKQEINHQMIDEIEEEN